MLVDSVELKHRGKEENYRPYLHVVGELRWSTSPPRAVSFLSWLTRRELNSAAGRWMVFVCLDVVN